IENSVISGNSAAWGGGLCVKRAVDSLIISNCDISGNAAKGLEGEVAYGGGIICIQCWEADADEPHSFRLYNCTIAGNRAETGGAICNYDSVLTVANCILWDDSATDGSEIAIMNPSGWHSSLSIAYSDAQGGEDEIYVEPDCTLNWNPGNIDADPCFVEEGFWDVNDFWVDGDYRLLVGSPCIDTGDPNYIPRPDETDLDGNPRIVNDRLDMGAYEYTPPIPAEINVKPKTLNLRSKGKSIACRIYLPEGYNIADIDPDSIFLEDEIPADWIWFYEDEQVVMAKFSRPALQQLLADLGTPTTVELLVSGQLIDGTPFEGTDTIRVIGKGHMRRRRVNSNSKVVDGIEYYIQTDKAVYILGENVKMLYRVTNQTDEDATFGFGGSPEWNFWVEKDAENIWTAVQAWWWFGSRFTLGPSEYKEYPYEWNMRDNDENVVNLGVYDVIGGLDGGSHLWDFTRVSVDIRIISDRIVRKEVDMNPDTIRPIDKPRKKPPSTSILRRKR
ncbi:MAG: choice-of-anchor Q domain-containing protein, partial [Planctomycetota bacterium]